MIYKDEIDAAAKELQVNPADVERDYVFGWLLSKIFGGSPLGGRLILKGGNALRKGYFPNTRYSGDLDFVTDGAFAPEELKKQLMDVCDAVSADSGVEFIQEKARVQEKSRLDRDLQVLEARLYFKDFYGKPGSVYLKAQLDVTEFERLMLQPQEKALIHSYSDSASCTATIRCVALEEILASKLKCLLQRRHVADLFDYVHWLVFGAEQVNTAEVLRVFLRKTIYSRSPGAAFRLLLGLPFQLLREAWSRYIVCPITSLVGFEDAVTKFMTHLRALFQGHPEDSGWSLRGMFFPAELSNIILEAGSRLTLIRMTYKGSERLVEPYSLKFNTRSDGAPREYFYCWNQTGGSSPPGLRTFVAGEIQAADVTDIAFEPRYPVEVSKAGDVSQAGSFAKGRPIPAFGITRPRHQRTTGLRYMFRCTVCHRLFARSSYESGIRAHKRRGGLPCYGRFGTYTGTRY